MEWKQVFLGLHQKVNTPAKIYSTTLISLFFTSLIFIFFIVVFRENISSIIRYKSHQSILYGWQLLLLLMLLRLFHLQNCGLKTGHSNLRL